MNKWVLLLAGALASAPLIACAGGDAPSDCSAPDGQAAEIDAAKLLFEYQSTDDDTGIHGSFDTSGFSELCIYGTNGELLLLVKPEGALQDLALGGIFFESREPLESEVSQASILAGFPAGEYQVRATSLAGTAIEGIARLSHDIPAPPTILFPTEGDEVNAGDLVVSWQPVTLTTGGAPASISGYEVIVTRETEDDSNGFSRQILSVHLPPGATSVTVPPEFLESGAEYELEVIALEQSGNQTITVVFFGTQ